MGLDNLRDESSPPTSTTTRTILLTVAYDGTEFCGWQIQPNVRTIQGELEKALASMEKHRVVVRGSGRTDAGVHAEAHPAAFRTESTIPLEGYLKGLNSRLPHSIAVTSASVVDPGFDPRMRYSIKHYRYTIYNTGIRSPFMRHRSWHIRCPLDTEAMQRGGSHLIGEHDFESFRASDCERPHAVRTIDEVGVDRRGELIDIDVKGPAFLKNMVRIIAGTLVDVGRGRLPADSVAQILEARDRASAGMTAPSCGLCLQSVTYPGLKVEESYGKEAHTERLRGNH